MALFFSGSVIAQGLSALAGLLVARWMTVPDYAIYTVMMTIVGAMGILTLGGARQAFTALLGTCWPDRDRSAQALQAAQAERRAISLFVLPPLLGLSAWLLLKNEASGWLTSGLLVLLLVNWLWDMRTRLAELILHFAGRAPVTQGLDAGLALFRVLGTLALFKSGALNSLTTMALSVSLVGLRTPVVRRWVGTEVSLKPSQPLMADRIQIRAFVRRQLPLDLFYCLQSQIILTILAFLGAIEATAGFGALSRIGQLLLPAQALMTAFALPRFSQVSSGVFRSFMTWWGLSLLPSVILLVTAWLAPQVLLWLVGPNYSSLTRELLVCVLGVAATNAAAMACQLAAHRGWNRWAWLQVPVVLVWCAIAPMLLNLTQLYDLLWFQMGFAVGVAVGCLAELKAAQRRGDLK